MAMEITRILILISIFDLHHPEAAAWPNLSAHAWGKDSNKDKPASPNTIYRINSAHNITLGLLQNYKTGPRPDSFTLPSSSEAPAVWYNPPSELVLGYITGAEKYPGSDYLTPGQLISGAITYAVQRVNDNPNLLPNTTLRFVIAETHGYEIESLQKTALLIHQNISAIIGPQETCTHEARLAAAFNVPMISYVSIGN